MSLTLTTQEVDAIWQEAEQHSPPATSIDRLETICPVPSQLGSGYVRAIELCPGLDLGIFNQTYRGLTTQFPENQHPVQFIVSLSGHIANSHVKSITPGRGYVGGSGIQCRNQVTMPEAQTQVGVDIEVEPHLFSQFFATAGELPRELEPLMRGDDAQQTFFPETTATVRSVAQQIIDCPLIGVTKQLYLQGKVFELMALQLDAILEDKGNQDWAISIGPKPDTIARIHYAAEILQSRLEHPPSQVELAQQVGVAYCTLHRGFRAVFGVTPFAYLTRQRMKQAEQLLRQPDCTVTEVARRVGYTNAAQFAAAFKRQFGISPSDCIRGSKMTW